MVVIARLRVRIAYSKEEAMESEARSILPAFKRGRQIPTSASHTRTDSITREKVLHVVEPSRRSVDRVSKFGDFLW